MTADKAKEKDLLSPRPRAAKPGVGFKLGGSALTLAFLAVLLGGITAGSLVLWRNFGTAATGGASFQITAESLTVTPQPEWVRTNVKEAVLRDGTLGQLEIRDPQLTLRVAQAFEIHPWVRDVHRVAKSYPAGVTVELSYREPAAMVEVMLNQQPGLLPVDIESVLLPPEDFSPSDARKYLRISAGHVGPAGSVGTPWGDERVKQAVLIAGLLRDAWQPLGLHRIVAEIPTSGDRKTPVFELTTRNQKRVLWGHGPGSEEPGEMLAATKTARLVKTLEQSGSLETASFPELDLRTEAGPLFLPRTARTEEGR